MGFNPLARMRLGMQTRSPAGKLRQMLCALEFERHYSKKEILEAYLNLAPYGGNVEGIARLLFGEYLLAFEIVAGLLITAAIIWITTATHAPAAPPAMGNRPVDSNS